MGFYMVYALNRRVVKDDMFSFFVESLKVSVKLSASLTFEVALIVVFVEFVALTTAAFIGGPGRRVKQTNEITK